MKPRNEVLSLMLCLTAVSVVFSLPARPARAKLPVPENIQKLLPDLSKQQRREMAQVLGEGPILGPSALSPDLQRRLTPPVDLEVNLDPAALAESGDGSVENPWTGAITRFLDKVQAKGTIRIPAGHYREINLKVPEGVWLVGEKGTVLHPPPGVESRRRALMAIVWLEPKAGLVSVELDGRGAERCTGVIGAAGAVVSGCYIHDVPRSHGVFYRAEEGAPETFLVVGNRVEYAGASGVRTDSHSHVAHNTVRHCGMDTDWNKLGYGNDGIITGDKARDVLIEHNFVVASPLTLGRHNMATQTSRGGIVFRNNICILEGRLRGALVLADGSSGVHVTRNLILNVTIPDHQRASKLGVHINGNDCLIEHNAVIGTNWGASVWTSSPQHGRNNIIRNNFLVVTSNRPTPLMRHGKNETNTVEGNITGELRPEALRRIVPTNRRTSRVYLRLLEEEKQSAAPATLVRNGTAVMTIVLPDDADELERLAAKELIEHLRVMSGAELQIATNVADDAPAIRLGRAADQGMLEHLPDGAPKDAFVLEVSGGGVNARGRGSEGTLNAAYELLEQIGVRWFMPGELGRVVPETPTVTLKSGRTVQTPSFPDRDLQGVHPDLPWCRRMRLSAERFFSNAHGFPGIKTRPDRKRTFAEHPEWFALVNDERVNRQLCVSNREMLAAVIENTKKYFRENPDARFVGIGPNDGYGYCECENCLAMDSGRISPWNGQPQFTDRYIKFLNAVVEAVEKEFPGKKYHFYAYQSHILPPTVEPSKSLVPFLAPINLDRIHGISNPRSLDRAAYAELLTRWSELLPIVYERGYYFNLATPGYPFSKVHAVRELIPLMKKLKFQGTRPECKPTWPSNGQTLYVATRLFWNADADVDAILDEYAGKFFGPASEPMRQYLQGIDDAYRTAPTMAGCSYDVWKIFPPDRMAQLRGLLDQAVQLAGESKGSYARRVALFDRNFRTLETFLEMMHAWHGLDFPAAKTAFDNCQALIDEQVETHLRPLDQEALSKIRHRLYRQEIQAPVMTPRAVPSYLKRFWWEGIESGLERTSKKGILVATLPDTWDFLIDPTDAGVWGRWFRDGAIRGNWQPMKTYSASWSAQGLHYYKGIAWYRTKVRLGEDIRGKRLLLWLGGVDEKARVWVNGQYIGSSEEPGLGLPGTPNPFRPVDFDITVAAQAGEDNTIAVRIENFRQNEVGTGGLVAPAMIWTPKE